MAPPLDFTGLEFEELDAPAIDLGGLDSYEVAPPTLPGDDPEMDAMLMGGAPPPRGPVAPEPAAAPPPSPEVASAPDTTLGGELLEVGKGIAPGAVAGVGTAMRGVAAYPGPSDEYRALLGEIEALPADADLPAQAALLDRAFSPDFTPSQRTGLRYAIDAKLRGDTGPIERLRARLPGPIQERALFQAGERVGKWGGTLLPAAPGYETSFGRQVGEGVGSLGVGVAASAVGGPLTAGLFFMAMGRGEAVDRAIQAGASDEEIVRAAALGSLAGATDVAPVEVLMGRLPVPGVKALATAFKAAGGRKAIAALGRVGIQTFVEGVQEGGQQFIQNWIAKEVHSPEQELGEGIVSATGVGSTVGTIAGIGREGALSIAGRRSRSARGVRAKAAEAVPEPSPEDEASPIPTETIMEGRRVVADAEAAGQANKFLEAEGMPSIGTPVRVTLGRQSYEGVVTDAWEAGEDAGITVTEGDGTVIDSTYQELNDFGAQIEILPNEYLEQDPALAGISERTREQDERRLRAGPTPDAMVDRTVDTEPDPEPGAWTPPPGLPTLSPSQAKEVADMVRRGVPSDQAIAVAAAMPAGDVETTAPVETEPKWTPPRPAEPPGIPPIAEETAPDMGIPMSLPEGDVQDLAPVETEEPPPPDTVPETGDFAPDTPLSLPDSEEIAPEAPPAFPEADVDDLAPVETEPTELRREVDRAEAETNTEPTDGQKEAGNYAKGRVTLRPGMEVVVENPKGSERSGRDRDGKPWSVTMPTTYGYVARSEGADGDQVDVYVGPEPESDTVFIVDQVDADTGAFDEHKVLLGYARGADAIADYDAAFNDGRGPERRGAVTQITMDRFRQWLDTGDTKKPVGEIGRRAPPPEAARPADVEETAPVESAEPEGLTGMQRLAWRRARDRVATMAPDEARRHLADLSAAGQNVEGIAIPAEAPSRPEPSPEAMVEADVETTAEVTTDEAAPPRTPAQPEGAQVILKLNGEPFKSERTARIAADMRVMADDFTIVPVEGGFGIQVDEVLPEGVSPATGPVPEVPRDDRLEAAPAARPGEPSPPVEPLAAPEAPDVSPGEPVTGEPSPPVTPEAPPTPPDQEAAAARAEPLGRAPDFIFRKDGQPYKTAKAAELGRRARRIGDGQVVEVEGGFAIEVPAAAEEADAPSAIQRDDLPPGWAMHRTSAGQYVADSAGRRTRPFDTPDAAAASARRTAGAQTALAQAREDVARRGLTGQEAAREVAAIMEARERGQDVEQPGPVAAGREARDDVPPGGPGLRPVDEGRAPDEPVEPDAPPAEPEIRPGAEVGATPDVEPESRVAPPPYQVPGSVPSRSVREVDRASRVITPAGRRVDVQPIVIEARDLIASHDETGRENPTFPSEFQPRDRSRAASQEQIASMAGELIPELLMPAAQSAEGAPVVGPDRVVESGNARTLAIRRAYDMGMAGDYRQFLADRGYEIEGFDQPVLAQQRITRMTPEERAEFAREANARTTADRGASEVATSDAASVTREMLDLYEPGDIGSAGNREFVRGFVSGVVPEMERAGMMAADGTLSQSGKQRIENALFDKAYGDPELLGSLREDLDTNVKSLGSAMLDAAPEWARMRLAVAEGSADPMVDHTEHIIAAVRMVRKARAEGTKLRELVAQDEMFAGDTLHPLAEDWLRSMYADGQNLTRPYGRPRLAEGLSFWAAEAQKKQAGANMFGETVDEAEIASMMDLTRQKIARIERERGPDAEAQADLLGGVAAESARPYQEGPGPAGAEQARPGRADAGRERGDQEGRERAAAGLAESGLDDEFSPRQLALFADRGPAPVPDRPAGEAAPPQARRQVRGIAKTDVLALEDVRVGLDHVRTPEDAAHVAAPFRKEPQETLVAVVLGEGDRLIGTLRHSIGTANNVSIDMPLFLGAIGQIPEARSFYIAHQHPSGSLDLSRADKAVGRQIADLTRNTDLDYRGSIVVAPGGREATFDPPGAPAANGRAIEVTPAPRRATSPVYRRRWTRIPPQGEKTRIATSAALEKAAREHLPELSGLMLLDNNLNLVGVMALDTAEMARLRGRGGAARDIYETFAETNASRSAIIARQSGTRRGPAMNALENMRRFARAMSRIGENGAEVDAVLFREDGTVVLHDREELSPGTFLQRAPAPEPILKKNGEPFGTRKSAAAAAKSRGLDAEPAEVPGGWGLEPRGDTLPGPAVVESEPQGESASVAPASSQRPAAVALAQGQLTGPDAPTTAGEAAQEITAADTLLQRRQFTPEQAEQLFGVMSQSARDAAPEMSGDEAALLAGEAIADIATKGVAQAWKDDSRPEYRAALSAALENDVSNDRLDAVVTEVVPGSGPRGKTDAETRVKARQVLMGLRGQTATVRWSGMDVGFARSGANKMSREWDTDADLDVLPVLPKLIENAIPERPAIDLKAEERGREGTTFHRLFSAVRRGDEMLRVELIVREDAAGNFLYHRHAVDMEMPEGERGAGFRQGRSERQGESAPTDRVTPEPPITVALAESQRSGNPVVSIQDLVATARPTDRDTLAQREGGTDAEEVQPHRRRIGGQQRLSDQGRAEGDGTLPGREPDARVRIRPTRRFDAERLRIRADIAATGQRAFGPGFNIRLADEIVTPEGDRATGAFDPAARIAYIALREPAEMTGTLHHEGLHYLRRAGAFTRKDGNPTASWKVLEAEASKWREKYRIDERYPEGIGEDLLNEEAIAEAIDDYAKNKPAEIAGKVKLAMDRILAFWKRLGNAIRGRGFQTAADVFEGIQAGEFAGPDGQTDAAAMDRYLQTAWHASPYEFDRFSTEHIGAGEGAQAYGWGLYFAEREGVADWYRETFSGRQGLTNDQLREYFEPGRVIGVQADGTADRVIAFNEDTSDPNWQRWSVTVENVRMNEDGEWVARPRPGTASARRVHSTMPSNQQYEQVTGKRVQAPKYRVNLAPKESEYLVYDRPLASQGKEVRDGVKRLWKDRLSENPNFPNRPPEHGSGQYVYDEVVAYAHLERDALKDVFGEEALYKPTPELASRLLLRYGIRGIKYLDQASRPMVGALGRARMPLSKETHNYVIFDDSDVAIEEIMLQRERLGEFETEPGAEGVDQAIIPGAEPLTERQLAERRMQGRMTTDREQKPMDEGLFGEPEGEQGTLFQRAPAPETPEFQQWFGGSRVVDDAGAPLIVYHGGRLARAQEEEAVPSIPHGGIFFTTDENLAGSYGRGDGVVSAYLKMDNPFDQQNPEHVYAPWVKEWIQYWREEDGWVDRFSGEEMSDSDVHRMIETGQLPAYSDTYTNDRWHDFLATARGHHDGYIGTDPTDRVGDDVPEIFVAFSPEQVKSTENRGAFSPSSPNIFYQRIPAENREAFEEAATQQFGVDMTGSAPVAQDNKNVIRKLSEELGDQLLGPTRKGKAEGIEVVDIEDPKDLNALLRWLAPPGAGFAKKSPELNKVWRQGVKAEIDQSVYIKRLNQEWDGITKPLSKPEFEQLTGLMFLGDAEARAFTDEELDDFKLNDKVKGAYKGARRFIDKLGRWTEQHERTMKYDLLKRRTALIRDLAGRRGQDVTRFREMYRERAILKGHMRHGRGNPNQLAADIDDADHRLHGEMLEDPEYRELAGELDSIEARLENTTVRRRSGYVPHKFFGDWAISAADPEGKTFTPVSDTGPEVQGPPGPVFEQIAGEHGHFPSRMAAIRAAKEYKKAYPDKLVIVKPVEFSFPDSKATVLTDAAYKSLRERVSRLMEVTGEDLDAVLEGVARPRNRRRFAGFEQYREGMPGFNKNLDRVIRAHIGETVRYTTLDRLKYDAITAMEKEGLQRSRVTQERPELQKAVEAFLRDVNGQKQPLETQVDSILNRPWATPLRVGLTAGGTAGMATGAAFASPLAGAMVGSYIGFRVTRSLARGGQFPSRAVTAGALSDMSHLKLGMLFNMSSAMVNLSQTALTTYPVLGAKHTMAGMRRFQAAVLSELRGEPNADMKALIKNDINPTFGFTEGTKNQFQKEHVLSKLSMLPFQAAESFNRAVALLGGMSKAEAQGQDWAKAVEAGQRAMHQVRQREEAFRPTMPGPAMRHGQRVIERTQFHYGAANKPELLRGNFLRVPLQFKNFMAQMMTFVFGLRGKEIPRFVAALGLTAGALGMVGIELLDWILQGLTGGWSLIDGIKEGALQMAAEGELEGGVGQLVARGIPGMVGVDLSTRTGLGDKFLPAEARDLYGPWYSTVKNAARHAAEGANITDQIRNLSPGIGNPLKALEAAGAGGRMTSPWKRGRPEMTYTPGELALKATGFRPVRESMEQDWRDITKERAERTRLRNRRYINQAVRAIQENDRRRLIEIMRDARESGAPVTPSQLKSGLRGMAAERAERTLRTLPRSLRGEARELRGGLDRMAPQ